MEYQDYQVKKEIPVYRDVLEIKDLVVHLDQMVETYVEI